MDKHIEKILELVKANSGYIKTAAEAIWSTPELGYKEWKTAGYLEERFRDLGYKVQSASDIPGFIADMDTGREGPKIAVLGELDAVLCATHPEADSETLAVHACGHNIQPSVVLGCAAVFANKEVQDQLSGSVRFVCVPAEETIDLEFRNNLIKEGKIKYVAGKIEFMRRGFFDDVDMAILVHAGILPEGKLFTICNGLDGCITKNYEYVGVPSHAGASPHLGVNAMYAASVGLSACNALRETFREKDYIRFHPIITQAGVAANAIPGTAKMQAYVRAATLEEMVKTNDKINRAIAASAAALGANVRIQDKPGNMPMNANLDMNRLFADTVEELFGKDKCYYENWRTGSSDVGDLSTLMPAIQPYAAGGVGSLHGADFRVAEPDKTCVNSTAVVSVMIHKLLKDDCSSAKDIISRHKPVFRSKDEYFAQLEAMDMDRMMVKYSEGKVEIQYK